VTSRGACRIRIIIIGVNETTTVLLLVNIIILLLLVLEAEKEARVVAEGVAAESQQRWKARSRRVRSIAENEIIEDPPAQSRRDDHTETTRYENREPKSLGSSRRHRDEDYIEKSAAKDTDVVKPGRGRSKRGPRKRAGRRSDPGRCLSFVTSSQERSQVGPASPSIFQEKPKS
jgi:hypothetical protein